MTVKHASKTSRKKKVSADVCLRIGGTQHGAVHVKEQQVEVCLSPAQRRRLFGRKRLKEIACGSSACVYEGSGDTVVKLTRDGSDVRRLQRAQTTGVVPRLHDTFRLAQGGLTTHEGTRVDVFAARLDRLVPLEFENLETVDRTDPFLRVVWPSRKILTDLDAPVDEDVAVRQITQDVRGRCDEACQAAAAQFVRLANNLVRVGVRLQDIVPENFGIDASDKLHVLDLGEQGFIRDPPTTIETFAEAQRTRYGRRPPAKLRSSRSTGTRRSQLRSRVEF